MGALIKLSPVLALFLFVLGAYIFMNIGRYLSKWRRSTERLARRYNGQVVKSRFPRFYPGMLFNYGRTRCELRNRRGRMHESGRQTDLVMHWPENQFGIQILAGDIRGGSWGWSSSKFALKAVVMDDPGFNENFKIQSTNPELAKKMMNSSVQWALEQLRRHTFKKTLYVSIRRGKMVISKSGFIKDYSDLDDFVRFGLELYDQLVVADVQGIEFLNEEVAKVVEEVKCPICSESVEEFMVVCLRCKTPHCYDCWQYNGRCATFACDETRYVRMDDRIKYSV